MEPTKEIKKPQQAKTAGLVLPQADETNPFVNFVGFSTNNSLDHTKYLVEDAPVAELSFQWFLKEEIPLATTSTQSGGRGFMLCKKEYHESLFKDTSFDDQTGCVIHSKGSGRYGELYLCMRHKSTAIFEDKAVNQRVNEAHKKTSRSVDDLQSLDGVREIKENVKYIDSKSLTGWGA